MGPQIEFTGVVAGITLHLLHHHLGRRQGPTGLDLLAGVGRIPVHVVENPVLEPGLHILPLLKGADLVPDDTLEIVGKAAGGEQIGQPGGQVSIGRGVRIIVLEGLLQGLSADKGGEVRVLAMDQGHKAVLGQFRLPPVADGNLGGTLHIHPTVIGGKGMGGQPLHGTPGLHPADTGTPAVELKGPVDIGGHGIG